MNLNFKEFYQSGINAPGRAGQHVWKPESMPTTDPLLTPEPQNNPNKHVKGIHLDRSFRPKIPAPFRGLTGSDFGSKFKRLPKISL